MAHNLTETSTYTANVTVPDGGDPRSAASVEAPFQDLADRTKYLKDHVDAAEAAIDVLEPFLQAAISGNNKANGAYYDIASPTYNVGGFTVASNEIAFPAVGKYLVIATADIIASAAELLMGLSIHKNGVEVIRLAARSTTGGANTDRACVTVVGIVDITNATTDRLKVASYVPGGGGGDLGTLEVAATENHVVIRRLN